MAYYDALAAKWATLSGTTTEKLSAINTLTVAGSNADVSVSSVLGYLALNGKLSNLLAYAASPPAGANAQAVVAAKEVSALFSTASFTTFAMSNAAIYAGVQGFISALVADAANTGITAADMSALLALAATTMPWWQSAGYTSSFNTNDLAAAGGLS